MEFIKTFTQFLNEADEKEVEEVEKEESPKEEKEKKETKEEKEKKETKEEKEKKSKKDGEELEITLNVIDDSKNLRNILKFLRGAKTDLIITCKEVDGEKETTFDWTPKKDDSILFLDVQEVDEDKSKQAEENEKDEKEDETNESFLNEGESKKKVKIDYQPVDKDTYSTCTTGLEFNVTINGVRGRGYWRPTRQYCPDGVDVNELQVNGITVRIFKGGGTHRTYEISSKPTLKEKQPKDLRFAGRYYSIENFKKDFIYKIKAGINGELKDAELTPEFIETFKIKI